MQDTNRWNPARLMPLIGPVALFLIWDLVVRFKLIPPILLPSPWATLGALFTGMGGGSLSGDFAYTLLRTSEAFLIAAVMGVPLGVLLGSNERAYRSVEFVIDFFRSTPSSALIPLFLMIFGVSDINKVAIAAFGALLIVLFNSAYGVINAQAKSHGGQGDGRQSLSDFQRCADLGKSAANVCRLTKRRIHVTGDCHCGGDVHWF